MTIHLHARKSREGEADALWSAQEVRTQAEQARGQVDIWEAISESACAECNAESGEACWVGCLGVAALGESW